MRLNKRFIGWLGASALLLTTACSNDQTINTPDNNGSETANVFGKGSNSLSLTLSAEGVSAGTRDFNSDMTGNHISDGTKANILLFTVYEVNNNSLTVATEFKKEPTDDLGEIVLGEGQNALKVEKWPLTIQLQTDPEKTYRVAFWAQNNQTKAFTTSDLENVVVDYASAKNNDELRDAFCAVTTDFKGNTPKEEVILRRPFAQVNVGTTGADYANILQSENMYPNRTYLYSKVVLRGASNKINVTTDEISRTNGFTGEVTFDWNQLASYWLNQPEGGLASLQHSKDNALVAFDGEEFLKVKLNANNLKEVVWMVDETTLDQVARGDDGFFGYKKLYPTMKTADNDNVFGVTDEGGTVDNDTKLYLSETFKYMSMCYVLVPATKISEYEPGQGVFTASTLDKLEIYFAETPAGQNYRYVGTSDDTDENGYVLEAVSRPTITLSTVPVQRNWRTNILGGLADTDYEFGPNDETSLFNTKIICIHRDPIFTNEYNGIYPDVDWFSNEADHLASPGELH